MRLRLTLYTILALIALIGSRLAADRPAHAGSVPLLISDPVLGAIPNPDHPLTTTQGFYGQDFGEGPNIVLLGDSTTYQVAFNWGYPTALMSRYANTDCRFGVAALAALDGPDLYVRYTRDIAPHNPDLVIIMPGVAHLTLWPPELALHTFQVTVETFDKRVAGETVYWMSAPVATGAAVLSLPTYWEANDPVAFGALVEATNGMLYDSVLPVLDAAREIDWTAEDFADTRHLSAQGQTKLATWLDEALIGRLCN